MWNSRNLLGVILATFSVALSTATDPRILFSLQSSCDPVVLQAAAVSEQIDLKVTPHHIWDLISSRAESQGNGWFTPKATLLPRVLRSHMDGVKRISYGVYTRTVVLEMLSQDAVASAVDTLKEWGAGGCLSFVSKDNSLLTVQSEKDAVQGSTDPNLRDQWGLFAIDVMNDHNQHVPGAWASTTGEPEVIVAVVDTGVDVSHADLQKNVWRNTKDKIGDGMDNEGNGFVDDVLGYNFVEDIADVTDKNGHGTQMAGVIAAEGDNGVGVAGVAMDARIMALKAFNDKGTALMSDVIRALDYAAFMGAQVVLLPAQGAPDNSSGTTEDDFNALKKALEALSDEGIMVVVPAGNGRKDLQVEASYPAAWKIDTMMVVAASGGAEAMADFSSYGASHVDIVAPGVSITTTGLQGEVTPVSGTSVSASFAAGVAALVLSDLAQHDQPYQGCGAWVKQVMMNSVDYHQQYVQSTASGGRVNAGKAVSLQQQVLQLGRGDSEDADGKNVERWDIDLDPQASPVKIALDASMYQQRGAGPIMRADAPERRQSKFSLRDAEHFIRRDGGDVVLNKLQQQPQSTVAKSHFSWLWNSIRDARVGGLFHACDDLRDCGAK